jgi:hypothetical protein
VAIANTSASALSVAGNITGGNLNTAGNIVSTRAVAFSINAGIYASMYLYGGAAGGGIDAGTIYLIAGNSTATGAAGDIILQPGSVGTLGLPSGCVKVNVATTSTSNSTGALVVSGGVGVAGNIYSGGLISATGNITGGNLSGTNITGTLATAAQTNITSVGTLGALTVTANTTSGNLLTGGLVSAAGNITGGNILGGANVNATTHTGTTVSVTSTVTGSQFNGSGAGLTSIPGGNVTGTVPSATSATTAGTVTTAAQPNITSVGTLTGLTINNATTAITNGAANGVGNIGTSANSFNTIFAKATSAQYADLAEMYVADADYPPGTVLEFGGTHEVTVSNTAASALIAGVVSTNPAHLMNSTAQGKHLAAIALVGRVPTLVIGPVSKGAMMVSAGNGYAQASATPAMGTVIGKAVEDFAGKSGTIEIAVGRL